jgi:hypothetical protein
MKNAALAAVLLALATSAAAAQDVACAPRYAPCHVADRLSMAGVDDPQAMQDFLHRLHAAERAGDRPALAAMVRYPLTVDGETYENAQALLAGFDRVFTPNVRAAIRSATYASLFVNAQGAMIGDGQVWLDGWTCAIAIKAINP